MGSGEVLGGNWKKRSSLGWKEEGLLGLGLGELELGVVGGLDNLWERIHSVALTVDLPPVAARASAANSSGKPILSSCSISMIDDDPYPGKWK